MKKNHLIENRGNKVIAENFFPYQFFSILFSTGVLTEARDIREEKEKRGKIYTFSVVQNPPPHLPEDSLKLSIIYDSLIIVSSILHLKI